MKKNGFTLVELLAVITLLALIAVVVITNVSSPYRSMKKDLNESEIKLIYSAAETYIQKHKNDYPTIEGNIYCITIKDLIEEGLLEDNLINAMEDSKIDTSLGIKVTVESKVSYEFLFDLKESVCTK